MAQPVGLDDPLEAIVYMDKINKDFPSDENDAAESTAAEGSVLDRMPRASTLVEIQSLEVKGHGNSIPDLEVFPSRTLRPRSKSASNNGASSSGAAQGARRPRHKPYDRSNTSYSPVTSEQGLTKFKCSYKGCEHETIREDNMKKHIAAVHLRLFKWTCPICAKRLTQRHNGPEHIARGHRMEHECPVCAEKLDWKQMVQHLEDPNSTCIQTISGLCSQQPEGLRHLFTMPADH